MINFFLHREAYVGMLTIDIVDVCNIETYMSSKLKNVVTFLKITICFLLSRPFGSIKNKSFFKKEVIVV